MHQVSIVGRGRIPIVSQHSDDLRRMGATALRLAMQDAGIETIDALYVSNMLADELQNQKHVATLIASEAGLRGVEALHVRAATAGGAAALHAAFMAVASGNARVAVALGVEQMNRDLAVPALAKALDAHSEIAAGMTLLSQNARLMQLYLTRHNLTVDVFNHFPLIAHANARHNPYALFRERVVTAATVANSRVVSPPLRLYDAAPICDGAAAVVVARRSEARAFSATPVDVRGSGVATDWFRIADRADPLFLFAAQHSAEKAFAHAGLTRAQVDFFELHDAFSIMACLILEAVGFAPAGEGWRLAADGALALDGRLPIATLGGLKARGHPIGATALYQACEIIDQLTGRAGGSQLGDPRIGMLQSVGGAGGTVLTHLFGRPD